MCIYLLRAFTWNQHETNFNPPGQRAAFRGAILEPRLCQDGQRCHDWAEA